MLHLIIQLSVKSNVGIWTIMIHINININTVYISETNNSHSLPY